MRCTLLADGSSDIVLLPILGWLLKRRAVRAALAWADLRKLPVPPKTLPERIQTAIELYPCDLLFVHRDAEREPRANRVAEIRAALDRLDSAPPAVCVIPVRMQEAWLLFDEPALRRAAGHPSGKMPLNMPALERIEQLADPKQRLHDLLRQANGLQGRRAKQFSPRQAVHHLADLIDDFGSLQRLPAFQALELELDEALTRLA